MTRREFMLAIGVGTLLPGLAKAATSESTHDASSSGGQMQYRTLGRTGEKVSIVGIGGAHLGFASDDDAIRIVRTAIDNGINFMDNCWDYGINGLCETRMGNALRDGYRQKAFLMTKIDGRTKQVAAQQLDESLRRLQTDHLDLLQFHEVIRMNDPERIFAEGGGMEAALAAKKAGKIRYIGFTGHKDPDIHLHMLQTGFDHGFTFDTVQMPLNVMDAHYSSFEHKVLPVLVKHNIGVLGMKPMGAGEILKSKTVTPVECLQYAMTLPTSVVITGCDSVPVVHQAIDTAKNFRPLSKEQVASLLAKTADVARDGSLELYKVSHHFDGTYQHPEWMG
jgi:predicted aldo/keto reductase-like oxidoreductase